MAAAPTVLFGASRSGRGNGPARQVRRAGLVPAVVYGLASDNETISVDAHDLDLILHSPSGSNTVITLKVDGGRDQITLCRQIHRHPVKQSLLHVDFVRVDADVAVQADVPLELIGEPESVRNGGLLEQLHVSIAISARPGNIPQSIQYDITALEVGDQLHTSDLAIPEGVEVLLGADELVAQISAPRGLTSEEEAEAAAALAEEPGEVEASGDAPAG